MNTIQNETTQHCPIFKGECHKYNSKCLFHLDCGCAIIYSVNETHTNRAKIDQVSQRITKLEKVIDEIKSNQSD